MPCNSDYLNPTERERELQRAAKLLIYVHFSLGVESNTQLVKTANDVYATKDYVPSLCREIRKMSPEDFERIVYNARDPISRDLADWWERHEAEDNKREKTEADRLKRKQEVLEKLNFTEVELKDLLR